MWPSTEAWLTYEGPHPWVKLTPLLQQLLVISSCSSSCGICCLPPFPCWSFRWFELACWHNSASLYVDLPFCVQTTLVPCSHPLPPTLIVFLSPLSQWFPDLGRRRCDIDVFYMAEHSIVCCSLYLELLWLCVHHHLLEKEASLRRVEVCFNLWL